MALQTIPGGVDCPPFHIMPVGPGYNSSETNGSLNGTSRQKHAWIFQIPKTGTLDKFEIYCGFDSSPSDIKVSFQDVDAATGLPDAGVDQFRVVLGAAIVGGTWIVPGLITSDGTDGGSKRSVTRGQYMAVVLEWNSATTGQAWFYTVYDNGNNAFHGAGCPYLLIHNGTSWTKGGGAGYPTVALKYNDGTYESLGPSGYPLSAITQRNFASDSAADERALRFKFASPVKVRGGWVFLDLNAACDVVLYDSDGTSVLATASLDSDIQTGTSPHMREFSFDSDITLVAGSAYRLAIKPTTTTSCTIWEMTCASAAILAALRSGAEFYLSTRVDAGSWTDVTAQRPFMGVRVSAVDDAAIVGGTHAYGFA